MEQKENITQPLLSWSPQPGPQTAFINVSDDIFEVLYGGARGGGKTDAILGLACIRSETYGRRFHALIFRRTLKQLASILKRSHEIYPKHNAVWNETNKTWTFPNGARVQFAYLESDNDWQQYHGWNVQMLAFEELTNFPNEDLYRKMIGICRSAEGVPCIVVATANPGGPGHNWVKARFIDPAPEGYKPIETRSRRDPSKVVKRVFIPAKVADNPKLAQGDPTYVARLEQTGSEEMVRAWLDGDWSVVKGAYFPEFNSRDHVIMPLSSASIPAHWTRFCCGDWGSAKPFAFYWIAVASEDWLHPRQQNCLIPEGALVVYREFYGVEKDQEGKALPNRGCRMLASDVGARLVEMERADPRMDYRVLDTSCFDFTGGPTIAEQLTQGSARAGNPIYFGHADKRKSGEFASAQGWEVLRTRLKGSLRDDGRRVPMLFFGANCVHLIRTLPTLQHDEANPENINEKGEDHAADAIRYGCMSRPYTAPTPTKPEDLAKRKDTGRDLFDPCKIEQAPISQYVREVV